MPAAQTNFEPAKIHGFVARIEGIDDEIASEKGEYMRRCRLLQDDRKDILAEAKAAAIPPKGLKLELRRRKAERKLEALTADADPEVVETADQVRAALGVFAETGLGAAAVAEAEKPRRGRPRKGNGVTGADLAANEPDLRPRFNQDEPPLDQPF